MKREKKFNLDFILSLCKKNAIFFMCVILLTIFGIFFMKYTWNASIEERKNQALQLVTAAEATFPKLDIKRLEALPNDDEKPEYKHMKAGLTNLVALNNDIRFAYIYTQIDGNIYFLMDSEPPDSDDYSPPGQEYTEASEITFQPFLDGKIVITKPSTDRWGTWISVLVPMKELETGKVIAVFGVDYPAENWNDHAVSHTIESGIIILCMLIILLVFSLLIRRNIELKKEKNKLFIIGGKLKQSEELFRMIFEQSPIGIAIGNKYNFITNINPMFEAITGRTKEELSSIQWTEITHKDDLQEDLDNFGRFKSGEINGYTMVKRFIKPNGSFIWVNMTVASLRFANNPDINHLCLFEDITERMLAEKTLKESERSKSVLLNNLQGMAYRCNYDREWTMQVISEGCNELTGYNAESLLYNKEKSYNELICPKYRDYLWIKWDEALSVRGKLKEEYEIITASGEKKWVLEQGQGVYNEFGQVEALEGLIIDITDRKMNEKEIRYMSDHDYLTGLSNRRFFEEEKKRLESENYLPLSIIIGDINGVKLINDAFGHAEGDKIIVETAKILSSCCRKGDILARTGGDEFTILLPKTEKQTVIEMLKKIGVSFDEHNNKAFNKMFYISISLGYNTRVSMEENVDQCIKIAEEYMYKHKLLERTSSHSDIISSIKATMFERSQETEEHAERLTALSKLVGLRLNLSQLEHYELELLSTLHDIGKVGIDDRILKKSGKLTDEEWVEMKKHSEIGYRIAMSSPQLRSIADYILCHHEHWDGTGYPQGLKGEEIPLLSRIIAVVDAYDAMMEDRIYRKAMTKEAVFDEIMKNAGTQFDPHIVKIFLDSI